MGYIQEAIAKGSNPEKLIKDVDEDV